MYTALWISGEYQSGCQKGASRDPYPRDERVPRT